MKKLKRCSKCKEWKKLNEFNKNKCVEDGLDYICRECQKQYYKKNKEKINNKNRQYYKDNIEKMHERSKKYYQKNKKEIKKKHKRYYKDNIKKRKLYNKNNLRKRKLYDKNNKEKLKIQRKQYCQKNIIKIRIQKNKHEKNKRKKNIHYRIRMRISSSINKKLKKRLSSKNGKSTFTFLPYTVDELKIHLENQFESWMNWSNWGSGKGKWNIDHVKPDNSFNYKNVEDKEFQECWALSNLQPLDAIENMEKGALLIW